MALKEVVAPTMNIAVTQYPDIDKVVGDASLTYTDSREFDGCVIDQFESAFSFIKSKLPVRGMIGPDGKRQDYLVIPEIAIREALANAIVHRDYSNADIPILETLGGIFTSISPSQTKKALSPMVVTPLGMSKVIKFIFLQYENAPFPIFVTLSAMATFFR